MFRYVIPCSVLDTCSHFRGVAFSITRHDDRGSSTSETHTAIFIITTTIM